MRSRKVARAITVALSAIVLAATLTGTAWAPKNLFSGSFTSDCTTAAGNEGAFSGSFALRSFSVDKDGALAADGFLTGTCESSETDSDALAGEPISAPITILQADCDAFDFNLDGVVLTVGKGTAVDVSPARVLIARDLGYPKGALCAVARATATGNTSLQARLLNNLLALPDAATS